MVAGRTNQRIIGEGQRGATVDAAPGAAASGGGSLDPPSRRKSAVVGRAQEHRDRSAVSVPGYFSLAVIVLVTILDFCLFQSSWAAFVNNPPTLFGKPVITEKMSSAAVLEAAPIPPEATFPGEGNNDVAPSTCVNIKVMGGSPVHQECDFDLKREPLRFEFAGTSIWLELEEVDGDVSSVIGDSAKDLGVLPIPQAHVTALYGMEHISEDAARSLFRNNISSIMCNSLPPLRPIGVLVDVELNGVNGGRMDMAWSEITLSSSDEHESFIDGLHKIFFSTGSSSCQKKERSSPWKPHLSLAYDNPEDTVLSLNHTVMEIAKRPSLIQYGPRKVVGISLWSTKGQMADWKCLERVAAY